MESLFLVLALARLFSFGDFADLGDLEATTSLSALDDKRGAVLADDT